MDLDQIWVEKKHMEKKRKDQRNLKNDQEKTKDISFILLYI